MALSARELAGIAVYELLNVADHVTRGAQDAQRAVIRGDLDDAREAIANVGRSAELFDMRWRDTVAALKETT